MSTPSGGPRYGEDAAEPAPDGPPPAPVVQRLRVRYAKRGRLRFTTHRDIARAFERALRRADVPMAYSAGFRPIPRSRTWVGCADRGGERGRVSRDRAAREWDPERLRAALDTALPLGLDVVAVVEAEPRAWPIGWSASAWQLRLPEADLALAEAAVEKFVAVDHLEVERLTKKGIATFRRARGGASLAGIRGR